MKYRDVDPKMKRLFPWSLFLTVAALLLLATCKLAGAQEDDVWACYGSARYEAMSSGFTPCNEMINICVRVREFLASGHTIEEGRAYATAKGIPQWIITKAERCVQ